MAEGMTIKQYYRERFFRLIEARKELDMTTKEGRQAFVALQLQIHICKSYVPKSYWKFAK